MEDFYELIEGIAEVRKETGYQVSITPRSNVASDPIEFALVLKTNTDDLTYDTVNCREAIGFLEGFTAAQHLKD